MRIRNYNKDDYSYINKLGSLLHNDYNYKEDEFLSCLVCEENGKVIGFITYVIIYERAEIIDIIINLDYRKKGYGFNLLKSAIAEIKKHDVENITLEVNSNNVSAIKLYEKHGFKVVAIRRKYYGDNDAYLMKKDLR